MGEHKDGDVCPICGKGKLKKKVITEVFNYKGEVKFEIPKYVIYDCQICEDAMVDGKSVKKLEKRIHQIREERGEEVCRRKRRIQTLMSVLGSFLSKMFKKQLVKH